jgi:hypothetical protein
MHNTPTLVLACNFSIFIHCRVFSIQHAWNMQKWASPHTIITTCLCTHCVLPLLAYSSYNLWLTSIFNNLCVLVELWWNAKSHNIWVRIWSTSIWSYKPLQGMFVLLSKSNFHWQFLFVIHNQPTFVMFHLNFLFGPMCLPKFP